MTFPALGHIVQSCLPFKFYGRFNEKVIFRTLAEYFWPGGTCGTKTDISLRTGPCSDRKVILACHDQPSSVQPVKNLKKCKNDWKMSFWLRSDIGPPRPKSCLFWLMFYIWFVAICRLCRPIILTFLENFHQCRYGVRCQEFHTYFLKFFFFKHDLIPSDIGGLFENQI